jgi:predicted nucleotidyltransferase
MGLWLFGSALRDDFHSVSDIDILVEFEPSTTVGLVELASLQSELTSLLGRPVDLVPVGGLKPLLRSQVMVDRKTLYAA